MNVDRSTLFLPSLYAVRLTFVAIKLCIRYNVIITLFLYSGDLRRRFLPSSHSIFHTKASSESILMIEMIYLFFFGWFFYICSTQELHFTFHFNFFFVLSKRYERTDKRMQWSNAHWHTHIHWRLMTIEFVADRCNAIHWHIMIMHWNAWFRC